MKSRISIVVPAYNEAETIEDCIDSVLRQRHSPHEIVVVDDCSTDQTPELARSYSDVNFLQNDQNQGVSETVARGFRESDGDLIVVLDADSILPDGWLGKIERHFNEGTGCVGGVAKIRWTNDEAILTKLLSKRFVDTNHPDIPVGTGICFNREICEQIGLFDELPIWGWDNYAPMKILSEGYQSKKVDDLFVYTCEEYSLRSEFERSYRYGKGKSHIANAVADPNLKKDVALNCLIGLSPLMLTAMLWIPMLVLSFVTAGLLYSAHMTLSSDKPVLRFLIEPLNRYLKAVGVLMGYLQTRC